MASLKSAVTWARLHVASDERESARSRKEGKDIEALCPQPRCNFDLLSLLFLLCFNILLFRLVPKK